MSVDLDRLIRKTKSYWYEDGLVEILAGLFFIVVGVLLLADWATPIGASSKWIWTPAFMLITLLWITGGRRLIGWLKERFTYPRTGYVSYARVKRPVAARRAVVAGAVGSAVALAVVGSLLYRQDIMRLVPFILGAGVAILLLRINHDLGLARLYGMVVWSVAIGCALAWLTADMGLSIALYYCLLGVGVTAAGVLTLVRYLRGTQAEAGND
jgi:hypothetical protein